jgi:hypothetical protein
MTVDEEYTMTAMNNDEERISDNNNLSQKMSFHPKILSTSYNIILTQTKPKQQPNTLSSPLNPTSTHTCERSRT